MPIYPASPASEYNPRRQPAPGGPPAPAPDALPEGIIHGRVDALFADGQVRISAAGRTFQFMPPRPLAPGNAVDIVVVAREPRLAIELVDDGFGADPEPEISRAATLIGRLTAPGMPRPGVIVATQPLLPAPLPDAQLAGRRLTQAIADSGLFYEAHQAEWVAGTRSRAQLAVEPQAQLSPATPRAAPAGTDAASAGPQTAARQLHTHPDALPLVRAQLDILDSRRLYWCGELWPGQHAEWEIRDRDRDASPETAARDRESRTWQTQLRLVLPHLGPVTAAVEARGNNISMRIQAAEADSTLTLEAECAELREALTAAGITVRELSIAPAAASGRPLPALIPGPPAP